MKQRRKSRSRTRTPITRQASKRAKQQEAESKDQKLQEALVQARQAARVAGAPVSLEDVPLELATLLLSWLTLREGICLFRVNWLWWRSWKTELPKRVVEIGEYVTVLRDHSCPKQWIAARCFGGGMWLTNLRARHGSVHLVTTEGLEESEDPTDNRVMTRLTLDRVGDLDLTAVQTWKVRPHITQLVLSGRGWTTAMDWLLIKFPNVCSFNFWTLSFQPQCRHWSALRELKVYNMVDPDTCDLDLPQLESLCLMGAQVVCNFLPLVPKLRHLYLTAGALRLGRNPTLKLQRLEMASERHWNLMKLEKLVADSGSKWEFRHLNMSDHHGEPLLLARVFRVFPRLQSLTLTGYEWMTPVQVRRVEAGFEVDGIVDYNMARNLLNLDRVSQVHAIYLGDKGEYRDNNHQAFQDLRLLELHPSYFLIRTTRDGRPSYDVDVEYSWKRITPGEFELGA